MSKMNVLEAEQSDEESQWCENQLAQENAFLACVQPDPNLAAFIKVDLINYCC